MKLVTLEKLERFYNNIVETYDAKLDKTSANPIQNKTAALAIERLSAAIENLKTEFEEFKPSDVLLEDESVTKEKLEQSVQDAIDKINDQMSREELDQTIADILAKIEDDNGLSDKVDEINAIVSGNTEAIEKAKEKDGELAQALANAVENAGETEKKVQNIQGAIADINTAVDNLTISKDTADEQIESLWENVRANQTSVAEINDSLTTHQTALNSQASDIAKIKDDLGALDGLAEMQETIQGIDEIVESLKSQDLDAYVKKTELKDGILTTIVEAGVLDEDKTSVNFYTKAETANEISTKLANYVKDSDLSTALVAYYTKDETPEAVKTEMLKSNILTKDADDAFVANVYTKAETADSIAESLSKYTDNVLSQYSTQAATSEAITSAVGDLNLNQYSTKTQTASAIEEAIESFDENNLKQNYYDRTATAAYVSQTLAGYETTEGLESKLAGYSTVEQTSSAISTEVAKISNNLTTNYSTTAQTAEAINTAIVSNNSNYYTKTETASAVTSQLSTYAKSADVDKKLEGYSSLTQTAAEIKAELYQAGLTESPESLTKVVVTPTEVTALVGDIIDEEVASGNRIATVSMLNQTKDSITATVNTVNDKVTAAETNIASQTANISVLKDAVGLSVTNNKLDGNKIVTAINVGDGSIAIDGKYIHITGDTVFDSNVKINGNLILDGTVVNDKIANGAITNGKLSADSVTADKIQANAVTADKIQAGAIKANHIEANAITAEKIAAGSITADKLAAENIDLTGRLAIVGGNVTLNENGLICTDSEGNSVVFNETGMRNIDSNGNEFAATKRIVMGEAYDGHNVTFTKPFKASPLVICNPKNMQVSEADYSSSNVFLVCQATNITATGFKMNCYTQLGAGSNDSVTYNATLSQANNKTEKNNYFNTGETTGNSYYRWFESNPKEYTLNIPSTATHIKLNATLTVHGNTSYYESGEGNDVRETVEASRGRVIVYVDGVAKFDTDWKSEGSYNADGTNTYPLNVELDFAAGATIKVSLSHKCKISYKYASEDTSWRNNANASVYIKDAKYNTTQPTIISQGTASFIAVDSQEYYFAGGTV